MPEIFTCNICNKSFDSYADIQGHYCQKKVYCSECKHLIDYDKNSGSIFRSGVFMEGTYGCYQLQNNKITQNNWYAKSNRIIENKVYNKNNDCKYYESKE
jgi:hypothetical protein